ncbi:MAG: HesB/IscA family protein [Candidatus Bipolaricaulia bacterium]
MIQISNEAAKWMKIHLASEDKSPEEYGLRLAVRSGGCSGLELDMRFDAPTDKDQIFSRNGVMVLVDPKSFEYLDDSALHYVHKLQGAGFMLMNPNITRACGCGSSFSVSN